MAEDTPGSGLKNLGQVSQNTFQPDSRKQTSDQSHSSLGLNVHSAVMNNFSPSVS